MTRTHSKSPDRGSNPVLSCPASPRQLHSWRQGPETSMTKVWLITGAGRGLGAEIAKAALAVGDRVVATDRDREQVERAFAGEGDRVLALALDVTDQAQALATANAAVERFGCIDVLVNNA